MTWHAAIGFKEVLHKRKLITQVIILLNPRGVETGVVPSPKIMRFLASAYDSFFTCRPKLLTALIVQDFDMGTDGPLLI